MKLGRRDPQKMRCRGRKFAPKEGYFLGQGPKSECKLKNSPQQREGEFVSWNSLLGGAQERT